MITFPCNGILIAGRRAVEIVAGTAANIPFPVFPRIIKERK
jgi:hypothetical protein